MDLSPIFPYKIYCCFDKKEWPVLQPDFNLIWPGEDLAGQCLETENQTIFIVVCQDKIQSMEDAIDTMAHEAYHGALKLHNFIGDENPSEEMTAILVGKITGFLFKEYIKE